MSSDSTLQSVTLGDVTFESRSRVGEADGAGRPVYGVDRGIGLTPTPKYSATNLERYKVIEPGMFAYNPMRLNIGSIGFCTRDMAPGLISPDYVVFGCKDDVLLPEFMQLLTEGREWQHWTANAGVGSVRVRIYYRELARYSFQLPSMEQQYFAAKTIAAIDDRVSVNLRINRTLEAIARSIFKAWFVRFEPVKAKADGARSFRGMPQEVFEQIPDRFEASELGLIPHGWDVVPLSQLVELVGGGTPKRKVAAYWGGSIPWFSVRDAPLDHDVWVVDTEERITEAGVENSSAKVMREGTTIISARGTVGRLALTAVPMAMNQSCYGIQGTDGVGDFFVYFTIHNAVVELQQRTHGSVFDTITRKTFDTLQRVRPQKELLDAFETTVTPLLELMRDNLFENRVLTSLRDTLLPRLISGEIRVDDKGEVSHGE